MLTKVSRFLLLMAYAEGSRADCSAYCDPLSNTSLSSTGEVAFLFGQTIDDCCAACDLYADCRGVSIIGTNCWLKKGNALEDVQPSGVQDGVTSYLQLTSGCFYSPSSIFTLPPPTAVTTPPPPPDALDGKQMGAVIVLSSATLFAAILILLCVYFARSITKQYVRTILANSVPKPSTPALWRNPL